MENIFNEILNDTCNQVGIDPTDGGVIEMHKVLTIERNQQED